MAAIDRLNDLRERGRLTWSGETYAWIAEPEEVIRMLSSAGFEECRREITRGGIDRLPTGGVWQGIDRGTRSVASAVWVDGAGTSPAVVFIDIDGRPFEEQ